MFHVHSTSSTTLLLVRYWALSSVQVRARRAYRNYSCLGVFRNTRATKIRPDVAYLDLWVPVVAVPPPPVRFGRAVNWIHVLPPRVIRVRTTTTTTRKQNAATPDSSPPSPGLLPTSPGAVSRVLSYTSRPIWNNDTRRRRTENVQWCARRDDSDKQCIIVGSMLYNTRPVDVARNRHAIGCAFAPDTFAIILVPDYPGRF